MANPTVIKLQDGNVMPQLGLGVWQASNEEVITAIQKALEVGYRSFDTAAAYKNEEGVGKALKNASVNREELFITTKLWNDDHNRPREALLDSLKKLQLDYIDLYLMHWPVPAIDHYVEAWKGMIELQKEGLIKSIGVCNFQIHHLQRLIDETWRDACDKPDRTSSADATTPATRLERDTQNPDRILEPISARRERRFRSESHSRSGR